MAVPWDETRLVQVEEIAVDCDDACAADTVSLVAEVRRQREQAREYVSLLECTRFALEWLIMRHVIEDGGADWKSKFDGSAFFACDCSESGGYMDYDVNAYEHTEQCASGFEASLEALYDQIGQALERRAAANRAP